MSRVSQMASMWQSKTKQQQTTIDPPKTQQPIVVQPQKQQAIVNNTPNKIQSNPVAKKTESTQEKRVEESKQVEMPRQSVAQLRKNLQNKLGPVGLMGLTRALQATNIVSSKKQPSEANQQQFKKMVLQNDNVVKNQRIPTFIQSKAKLQNMFQKKVTQKEGYHTGAPGQNSQGGYINLSNTNDVQNVTPEERTQQIMKRIFSAPQTQQPCFVIEKQKKQQTKSQSGHQQQVKNLNLRAPKKQKKDLGNFDDF